MNYNKRDLIERLSAEYVLGTLRGKARDRFESLMVNSYRIRLSVWSWENQINPLGTITPEANPPAHVWRGIRQRLDQHMNTTTDTTFNSIWQRFFWQGWSFSATTAGLVLALMLVLNLQTIQQLSEESSSKPERVAVVTDQEAQPQWLVSFDLDSGRLSAKALNVNALEAGKAFELWLLPSSGNPQSLGLLPVSGQSIESPLPLALIQLLQSANGIAVSLEPDTGSPTGLPTGPVVFQSTIIEL